LNKSIIILFLTLLSNSVLSVDFISSPTNIIFADEINGLYRNILAKEEGIERVVYKSKDKNMIFFVFVYKKSMSEGKNTLEVLKNAMKAEKSSHPDIIQSNILSKKIKIRGKSLFGKRYISRNFIYSNRKKISIKGVYDLSKKYYFEITFIFTEEYLKLDIDELEKIIKTILLEFKIKK